MLTELGQERGERPQGRPLLRPQAGLRDLGWPATVFPGDGPSGPVTVICVAVDRSRVPELTGLVKRLAPEAFWTVQPLGQVHGSEVPAGFAQVRS